MVGCYTGGTYRGDVGLICADYEFLQQSYVSMWIGSCLGKYIGAYTDSCTTAYNKRFRVYFKKSSDLLG